MKRYNYILRTLLGMILSGLLVSCNSLQNETVPTKSETVLDSLSTADNFQEESFETEAQEIVETEYLEKKITSIALLENWTSGTITGATGENLYTDLLKEGDIYGVAEKFLTFENDSLKDGYGATFVVAGVQEGDMLHGSIWFISDGGICKMLEQNVRIKDTEIQYQEVLDKRYLFFNYQKEGENCGRIFQYDDTTPTEILVGIPGRKMVDANGNIRCIYSFEDSKCIVEADADTGERNYVWDGRTEKQYIFQWYIDGTIREMQSNVYSEEELAACPYGEEVLRKVEEFYPDGIKQYIVRDNGEVNVNIAIEEKDTVNFYYMTFQTENNAKEQKSNTVLQDKDVEIQKGTALLTDSGTGCYLLKSNGDRSLQIFLDCFAGEDRILKNDLSILPWYLGRVSRYVCSEEEDILKDRTVEGMVFEPEGELLERLTGLVPDYSDSSDRYYYERGGLPNNVIQGSEIEREFYHQVDLLGKTDSFLLYGINYMGNLILETQDGTYLWIEHSYRYQPTIFEMDFDSDGEKELIITNLLDGYGTGIYVEALLIADKDENGEWLVYHLLSDWYLEEMDQHYQTEYIDGKMNLRVDEKLVGAPVDTKGDESYYYSGGAQIRFQIKEDKIYLLSKLMAYSDFNHSGSFWGNGIRMKIAYLGAGKWESQECNYFSEQLESEAGAIAYEAGSVAEITEIQYDEMLVRNCMIAEDFRIPVTFTGITDEGKKVEIYMDVFYESELMDDGREGRFLTENVRCKYES